MYVKLFAGILDSSIAQNTALRRFFQDFLLLCDSNGDVIMTKEAIARRLQVDLKEVEWGIAELQKPDPNSHMTDEEGRRIVPIEGFGFGWHIVNYAFYRGIRDADDLREKNRQRQAAFRAKHRNVSHALVTEVTPSEAEAEAKAEAYKNPSPRKRGDEGETGFSEWWGTYPKKIGKGDALSVWKKLSAKDRASALAAAPGFAEAWAGATADRHRFIPNPATFLRQQRWTDDPAEWQQQAGGEAPKKRETAPDQLALRAKAIMRGEVND